jgi:hypothetical protein
MIEKAFRFLVQLLEEKISVLLLRMTVFLRHAFAKMLVK